MNRKEKRELLKIAQAEVLQKKADWEKMHQQAISRRDLFAAGIIPFSAKLIFPSWLSLLSLPESANAQQALVCGNSGPASSLCPFIGIKLSGGMAMAGNFMPLDKGGGMLSDYRKLGQGRGGRAGVTYEFSNNVPFFDNSNLIAGIRAQTATNPEVLKKTNFIGVCVRSQDDSSGNKFDITAIVAKAGLKGKVLPNLGTRNTDTGVNNSFAYVKPSSPLVVGRYEDLANSLDVNIGLSNGTLLSNAQKMKLFESVSNLSKEQSRNISNVTGGDVLGNLIQCANQDNTKIIKDSASLNTDPLSNNAFQTIWGINNNTSKSSQEFVFATMVFNALNGNASTVNLEIGGFDYHNNTRTTGDGKDLEAGTLIGRVLMSMAALNKKGFIVVTSDGSVTSPDSDDPGAVWSSDRGTGGAAYLIGFDPAGAHPTPSRPGSNTPYTQLGHFTSGDGQAADDNFLIGGNVELAAGAMFVNYLLFNGIKKSDIDLYLPRVFSPDQIDLIQRFA